jgi:hypothetical protein
MQPLLIPVQRGQCGFVNWDIPRPFMSCVKSTNLQVSQTLSSMSREFHKFLSLGLSTINWQDKLTLSPLECWITLIVSSTCTTLAVEQLSTPKKEDCPLMEGGVASSALRACHSLLTLSSRFQALWPQGNISLQSILIHMADRTQPISLNETSQK